MLKVLQACLSSDVQELKARLNCYTLEVINNQGTVGKTPQKKQTFSPRNECLFAPPRPLRSNDLAFVSGSNLCFHTLGPKRWEDKRSNSDTLIEGMK